MSRGLICDNCGTTLTVNANGESGDGEDAGWLRIFAADSTLDVCTRACAHALLDNPVFITSVDAYTEAITGIALSIADERQSDEDES